MNPQKWTLKHGERKQEEEFKKQKKMKTGSLIELVDDKNWLNKAPVILPVKNKIYTVREIFTYKGHAAVYLMEIVSRPFLGDKVEAGFRLSRFSEIMPPMEISIEHFLEKVEKI